MNTFYHEQHSFNSPIPDDINEQLAIYDNSLLNALSKLLKILIAIPRQNSPNNIEYFRQNLLDEIELFQQKCIYLDYHPSIVEKSCFVICAALDEAILYSTWGESIRWENFSLLSKIFAQRNGGEIFFQLLEQACRQPKKLIDFIELQYLLLMLGFQGKYRLGNNSLLHDLKLSTYIILKHYRTENSGNIINQITPINKVKRPARFFSISQLLFIVLFILLSGYLTCEYYYFLQSKILMEQFISFPDIYK